MKIIGWDKCLTGKTFVKDLSVGNLITKYGGVKVFNYFFNYFISKF